MALISHLALSSFFLSLFILFYSTCESDNDILYAFNNIHYIYLNRLCTKH